MNLIDKIFATPVNTAPGPLRFHAMSLVVAIVAGVSTFGTIAVMLPASAMFLGWVGYSLGSGTPKEGFANLTAFVLGLVLGIGTALAINALTPLVGAAATPLAVSGVVILVLSLRTLAPVNNALAYFLGITSFFYSGLMPTAGTFAILATAGVIGAVSAAIAGTLQAAVQGQPA
jgi:hypothetical protein